MNIIQAYFGNDPQNPKHPWKDNGRLQVMAQGQALVATETNHTPAAGEQHGLFCSPDESCFGVFSGKIFAFQSLTADLPGELTSGQKLAMLLQNLFNRDGADFANALDGFFSILMVVGGKLIAVRDAIGERPLYLLQTPTGVLAANRMSALINHPDCTRHINPAAIVDYLSCGFVPFARTPVKNISKLPPGAAAVIDDHGIKIHTYHPFNDTIQTVDEPQCIEVIRSALHQAVDKRYEPGQKTALLLSGGLDSSLVGALLGRDRLACCYSLNFGDQYRHELEFSGLMAKHLGVPARVITITPAMVKEKFEQTARILDEPIGDPLTVPNIIIAEQVAQEAHVVFNGEGGDPVFGGPKNQPIIAFEAYSRSGSKGLSREQMYLRSYNKGHEFLPQMLTQELQQQVERQLSTAQLLQPYFNEDVMQAYLHRLLNINLRLKGAAQILPKVYKAACAYGFAIRSPLFDRQLAELAFSMPPAMKLKGPTEKYVLKQAVADIVPAEIINRPKSGMLVPVHYWFRKELKAFAKEILLDRDAKIHTLIRRQPLEELLSFKGGGIKPYHGDRIWLLLSLEFWLRTHKLSCVLSA